MYYRVNHTKHKTAILPIKIRSFNSNEKVLFEYHQGVTNSNLRPVHYRKSQKSTSMGGKIKSKLLNEKRKGLTDIC